jgi:hypothetical protein
MAGKVFIHATMSLDGFIADTAGTLDWAFRFPGPSVAAISEITASIGAVVAGRHGYDLGMMRGEIMVENGAEHPYRVPAVDLRQALGQMVSQRIGMPPALTLDDGHIGRFRDPRVDHHDASVDLGPGTPHDTLTPANRSAQAGTGQPTNAPEASLTGILPAWKWPK